MSINFPTGQFSRNSHSESKNPKDHLKEYVRKARDFRTEELARSKILYLKGGSCEMKAQEKSGHYQEEFISKSRY